MPDADAWSARYETGSIPWDLGRAHPELETRLALDPALGTGSVGSVLVPGAGTGHDAAALAQAGWRVTAVDIAPAVEAPLLRRLVADHASVVIADSLELDAEEPFDLLFDHTFFCAIDPADRPRFGAMASRVLARSGSVISIVFPIGRPVSEGGPPWGFDSGDLAAVLGDGFSLEERGGRSHVSGRRWPYAWTRWARV
ncbi:MAG: methyltransferase domain-containing protein [Acidimicrobiia bacterium]